jgi:RNA polymerase sigma-B factor
MASAADERAQRAELFAEYRRTDDRDVRDRLIEMNIGLAEAVARRFGGRGERRDDLLQVALVGLLKAVERFDPERGLAFSSFATPTIEGELKRHFRDKRWAVRVPRRLQEQMLEVNQSVAVLVQRAGRSPTIDEIAADIHLSTEEVLEALEAGRAIVAASIDGDDSQDGRGGVIERHGQVDTGLEHVERRMIVAKLLDSLPPRERAIVTLRFYDGLTQSEIAERFGVSQMQISRILARTLDRLRAGAGDALI